MVSRDQIVEAARRWKGTPWRHQGRTPVGIDCAGLIVCVAKELGLSDFDTADYQRTAQQHKLLGYFREHMDAQPLKELKAGDVILFRDSAYPCHVAMVAEKNGALYIIHAHAERRVVLEEQLSEHWKSKWVAGFKFKGVE